MLSKFISGLKMSNINPILHEAQNEVPQFYDKKVYM